VPGRRALSSPAVTSTARPFWILGATLALLLFASSVPSPLYSVYQERWGFSSFVLTSVFAVYALALLAALICLGALSDAFGRRPVLAAALVALIVAMVAFAAASSVAWLFVARIVQGIATGVATSALIAALAELEPSGDAQRAALVSSSAPTFGLAGGALGAGLLVQLAPAPRVLPYLCVLALFVVALAALLLVPESAPHRNGRWEIRPVAVRTEVRGAFAVGATGIVASWAFGGLVLSLGPSLAATTLDVSGHVIGGVIIAVLCLSGGVAQMTLRHLTTRDAVRYGGASMLAGLALIVLAVEDGSAVALFSAAVLIGVGFGLVFMGSFRSLAALARDDDRAELLSAIYVVAYLSMSVPAVAAGLAVSGYGLKDTTVIFACATAATVVVAILGTRRSQTEHRAVHVPCPCSAPAEPA
jgi:MFS family permease